MLEIKLILCPIDFLRVLDKGPITMRCRWPNIIELSWWRSIS